MGVLSGSLLPDGLKILGAVACRRERARESGVCVCVSEKRGERGRGSSI